uniref:IS30 family transposase n=2 Tax=Pyramidobacter porci TaxID=2605789 RepID=UPI002DDAAEBB|nr:IS30 family transposase [Pyramidobacter porci]
MAQGTYRSRRKVCHPRRKLDDEQIAARLKEEKSPISISYATIYRGICSGAFVCTYLKSVASSVKRLRRRGKRRRRKTAGDHRGWHPFMFKLAQRPKIANERRRLGDWEADTVCGTIGKACRVTLVDRKSRMLLCRKAAAKTADCVAGTIIDMLKDLPHESITPDRGCEFCNFEQINAGLGGTKLYYPKPHQPWQRGTNENTNGLLREYFPKEKDVTDIPDDVIKMYVKRLNSRPRKCLHWKSPYEVFCSDSLRLG